MNLEKCPEKLFYYADTFDDDVIASLASQNTAQVYATDDIISQLVACSRSVYPWDILVRKAGKQLFFYKRNNAINMLTVNETSREPPNPADKDTQILMNEATQVSQYFSQHILNHSKGKDMQFPNPFYDEDEEAEGTSPAPIGYRYRKFHLNDECDLILRTQINGICKKGGVEQYFTTCCLNEWQDVPRQESWRAKVDTNVYIYNIKFTLN